MHIPIFWFYSNRKWKGGQVIRGVDMVGYGGIRRNGVGWCGQVMDGNERQAHARSRRYPVCSCNFSHVPLTSLAFADYSWVFLMASNASLATVFARSKCPCFNRIWSRLPHMSATGSMVHFSSFKNHYLIILLKLRSSSQLCLCFGPHFITIVWTWIARAARIFRLHGRATSTANEGEQGHVEKQGNTEER